MTRSRIAGAPISWGVCEVPGWGEMLSPARVLDDMRDLGITATELGPDGWLADDAAGVRSLLDARGMQLVGGFVTAVLHESGRRASELGSVARQAELLAEAGAQVLVLACSTGAGGYEGRVELDDAGWSTLLEGIDRVQEVGVAAGLDVALHPHVGTLVERDVDLERILSGSGVGLCVDTGHMAIGGIDAYEVVASHPRRIVHVHLKDVRERIAARVRSGDVGYAEAVASGMYAPLGTGDARVADVVLGLERAGYDGWYVLEQDVRWAVGDVDPVGDVVRSRDLVRALLKVAVA